jgi:hypothetical protein
LIHQISIYICDEQPETPFEKTVSDSNAKLIEPTLYSSKMSQFRALAYGSESSETILKGLIDVHARKPNRNLKRCRPGIN